MDTVVQSEDAAIADQQDFYIVGIGASAGGLEALENLFQAMPEDTGMAFVIVQHLSPDFKSLMDELLARHTKMPIFRVEDRLEVKPNCLYLIPPNQEMIISGGRLLLKEKERTGSFSLPIDHFLRSLAQDVGPKSIGVILSGTGSDGSRGLRDVHEAGGLVVAQSVESAKFDGMPKSAVDTGLVDAVTNPEEIPAILTRYIAHPLRSQFDESPVDESSLEHVFRLLQERHRVDFNYYKPSTISRRLERRIQLNRYNDIDEYVRSLEKDVDELDQLYRDLLIGVTQFFRDREAFESLRWKVLPKILAAHPPREEFRVWVAACGTGEEAYSLAITIDECLHQKEGMFPVKIFATDIHQASLDFAHSGIYSASQLEHLSDERRDRYFISTDSGYQISPEIRQKIVFAPHNLVKDTPFTKLHLITCRNILIYLKQAAQKKVLSLFHFGLKAGGILFLGASESPGDLSDEFKSEDDRWRIYCKRRDVRLPREIEPLAGLPAGRHPMLVRETPHGVLRSDSELIATYDELLSRFMPGSILVNEQREIIHMFGGAGKFLSLHDGRLSSSLLDHVEGDLKLALTGGLQRAGKTGEQVCYNRIQVASHDGDKVLQLEITPIFTKSASPKYLVTFKDPLELSEAPAPSMEPLDIDQVSRDQLQDLENELRYTKENLQATIEELETSNEELQATNEELTASNEELQSTNEELHSVNEELYTVNAEHQKKIVELTELTNDMDNLLESTEVHTLFLDANLCVRKFTPKIAEVFNLVPHDVGRRIGAFSHSITCHDLSEKVSRVLSTGERFEERVSDNDKHQFLLRLLPYRTSERISGAVLTLIDINSLAAAENEVIEERERFERAIAANQDGTWDWPDVYGQDMWWSPSCYTLLGYEPDEFPPRYAEWLRLIHPEDRERVLNTSVPTQDQCFVELHREFEYRMLHKSGGYRWYRHRAIVDYGENGKPNRMTGSVGDIHDRKCAEMQNKEEIRRRDNFLAMLSHELRNPMGAVLNSIDWMNTSEHEASLGDQTGPPAEESSASPIGIIERQTKHMARLLDDLLDVARFGQNKIEFRQQVVDLTELGQEVIEAVSHQLQQKNQELHVSIDEQETKVFADPARIKQAQVNVLNNASKYTPEGGQIWYELQQLNGEAIITVSDNGVGIPPEAVESIFELFVQSESTLARSSGGIGVGLSLARSIIMAHRGMIVAESEGLGKGSKFSIRLPMTDLPTQQIIASPHVSFIDRKLLLVEDNEDARTMLAKTLRLEGFEVKEASDGCTALVMFQEYKPDIAVVDIGLPQMDGYQFAKRVRDSETDWKFKLIALTGYGRDSDRQAALDAGFDAHLVKPLDPNELFRAISSEPLSETAQP